MDRLHQCQKWNGEGKFRKVIDTLRAIPYDRRTPEEDLELAFAYMGLADPDAPEGQEMLGTVIDLLEPLEDSLGDNYDWNFRLGYAHFHMEEVPIARSYFKRAEEASPGDAQAGRFLELCDERIALPRFRECFWKRVENTWEDFADREADLRRILDMDSGDQALVDELLDSCSEILTPALGNPGFEMRKSNGRYILTLSPGQDDIKLLEMSYFRKHVPEKVSKYWDIDVGLKADSDPRGPLMSLDGRVISGEDVQVWVEKGDGGGIRLTEYCEKLRPLMSGHEDTVQQALEEMTRQVMGEIPCMRYVRSLIVVKERRGDVPVTLGELPDLLRDMGVDLSLTDETCLNMSRYRLKPHAIPDADWRMDVKSGTTCFAPLINGYLLVDSEMIDQLRQDGVEAGFLCYPLDTLREEKRKITNFRTRLMRALRAGDNPDVLMVTGAATGLYYGYVDFIAWDILGALNRALDFFEETDIPWLIYHSFRREAGTIILKGTPEDMEKTMTQGNAR